MKQNAKLDINKYKDNDQKTINNKFIGACVRGDIDLVNFLLDCKELTFHPELAEVRINSFNGASIKGGLEIYKLLEKIYTKENMEISWGNFGNICSKDLPRQAVKLRPSGRGYQASKPLGLL